MSVDLTKDPYKIAASDMWRMFADHNRRMPQVELNINSQVIGMTSAPLRSLGEPSRSYRLADCRYCQRYGRACGRHTSYREVTA